MTHHLVLGLPFLLAGALLGASGDAAPAFNRFAAVTYRELSKEPGNLILSPFNISTALSMLLAGARGSTAAGIAGALQTGAGPGYDAAVAALCAELTKQANLGANQLAMANGLWVERGFAIEPVFENTIKNIYQASLTPLDFREQNEQARQQINSWTARQTHGKITDLFKAGSIKRDTRMVLASAIYFLGKWDSPFDPRQTLDKPFHAFRGQAANAKFMHRTSNFPYAETPSARILEMKYAGTTIALDIVLPKADNGLAEMEQTFTTDALQAWVGGLTIRKVQAAIPKFRAESGFALERILANMGMADAFSPNADFSGIDGRHDLFVGNVVHKAFIDVAEEGTEAAAATGIGIRAMAMRRPEETVVFSADRPFLFFIRDTASGTILFEGRLAKP